MLAFATHVPTLRQRLQRAVAGDSSVEAYEMNAANPIPTGCDGHPSLAAHAAMAEEMSVKIRATLGW